MFAAGRSMDCLQSVGSGLGLGEHMLSELAVPSEDTPSPSLSPPLVSSLSQRLVSPTAQQLASVRTMSRFFAVKKTQCTFCKTLCSFRRASF